MNLKYILIILLIIISCLLLIGNAVSLNVSNIIAYPVPFNPKNQVLRIGYKPDVTAEIVNRALIEIFDINGDKVFLREYSSLSTPVIWNGRNNVGKRVKPGLYIIKITVENYQTGEQDSKIIRIVIIN